MINIMNIHWGCPCLEIFRNLQFNTTEIISSNGSSTSGPNMPIPLSYFAIAKMNKTMSMLIGGATNGNLFSNSTWYYNHTTSHEKKVKNSARNDSILLIRSRSNPYPTGKIRTSTLEEWLDKFVGIHPRSKYYKHLKLLWFDVKVSANRYELLGFRIWAGLIKVK